MAAERQEPAGWLCSHDGYLPSNRANWCDLGCGSDYNQMVPLTAVVVRHFERLARQLGKARYGGLECCDDHESYSGYCEKCRYFRFYATVAS